MVALTVFATGACRPPRAGSAVRLGAGQALRYRVVLAADLRTAQVHLDLPPPARGRLLRLPRTAGWKVRRWRIARVRCDGHRIYYSSRGGASGGAGWLLPRGCARATWRLRLTPVGDSGYLTFSLQAVHDPKGRWAFLPGAAALLEVAGVRGRATLDLVLPAGTRAHHTLDRLPNGRLLLPPAPSAHLALVGVGAFVQRQSEAGGVTVRHRFAEAPPARFTSLLAVHGRGLRYLVGVFGRPRSPHLDAWWFHLGPSARMVSGYAGRRAVAISYVDRPKAAPHLTAALLPWLPILMLLHEQVHQLGVTQPAWLSESLAQYYALKALGRAGALPPAAHTQALDRITRPWSRPSAVDARVRLLAAHRRYLRTGSVRSYRIFYTNGARFWWTVDRAIGAKSRGKRSLDTIVRRILKLRYDRWGRPPRGFSRLLRRHGGDAALKAMARWMRPAG